MTTVTVRKVSATHGFRRGPSTLRLSSRVVGLWLVNAKVAQADQIDQELVTALIMQKRPGRVLVTVTPNDVEWVRNVLRERQDRPSNKSLCLLLAEGDNDVAWRELVSRVGDGMANRMVVRTRERLQNHSIERTL